MELKEYSEWALKTESKIDAVVVNPELLFGVLTTIVSAGEMLDQIKKNVFYGKDFNIETFALKFKDIVDSLDLIKDFNPETSPQARLDIDPRVFHAVVGITTEAAELIEAMNFDADAELDNVNLAEEAGDIMWYSAILFDTINQDWGNTLDINISKLKARYPDNFNCEDAINRDLDTERDILESGAKGG